MKEQLKQLIAEVEAQHPYVDALGRKSYNTYNEGWSAACDALEQKLDNFSPWVSVDERLPKEGSKVLCPTYHEPISKTEPIGYEVLFFDEGRFYFFDDRDMDKIYVKPKFWQPITAPN